MWKDFTHQQIVDYILTNNLRTKYILLGFSYLFDYKRYSEIFDTDNNGIHINHRKLVNLLLVDMTNSSIRCRRISINNDYIKIQTFELWKTNTD